MIERLQQILADQPLDHIITGHQHVIGFAVGDFDVHLLVGVKILHNDGGAGGCFKVLQDVLAGVFAPVIEVKRLAGIGQSRGCAADARYREAADHDGRQCQCGRQQHFASGEFRCALAFGDEAGCQIDEQQHDGDDDHHQCGDGVDTGVDTLAHGIDHNAEILDAAAGNEIRNDEIIDRHRKGDQRT